MVIQLPAFESSLLSGLTIAMQQPCIVVIKLIFGRVGLENNELIHLVAHIKHAALAQMLEFGKYIC